VIQLINDEVTAYYTATPTLMDKYLSTYMKYETAAADANRGQRAQTTIYAPYWGTPNVTTKVKFHFPNAAGSSWQYRPFMPRAFKTGPVPIFFSPDNFLDWKLSPTNWLPRLCKFGCGLQYLLGMNLFTGGLLPVASPSTTLDAALQLQSPQALALYHKTGNPPPVSPVVGSAEAWPVLAVVAGMSKDEGDTEWLNKCCGDNAAGRDVNAEVIALENETLSLTNTKEAEYGTALIEPEVQKYLKSLAPSTLASLSKRLPILEPARSRVSPVQVGSKQGDPDVKHSFSVERKRLPVEIINKGLEKNGAEYTNAASLVTLVCRIVPLQLSLLSC
jgi:hypothetical protein